MKSKEEEFDEITGRKGKGSKRINKTVDKTKNQLIDQRKNKEDTMYTDISRLVKILERIAKRVEREMKNNKYGN